MTTIKHRKPHQLTQILSIVVVLLAITGCGSEASKAASPTPTPTPVPPPDITDLWSGCIQISFSPDEHIKLNVTEEKANGSFSGEYTEDWGFLGANIVGTWPIYDTKIMVDGTVRFSAHPVTQALTPDFTTITVTATYDFTGKLVNKSKMTGQVTEDNNGASKGTHPWKLIRNGNECF